MREPLQKIVLVALAFTLLVSVVSSEHVFADEMDFAYDAHLKVIAGYRTDNLDWNIAGDVNGDNPNILSELTWDDLKIHQLKTEGVLDITSTKLPWFSLYFKSVAGYGWISDGKNRDSDYAENNRTGELSRSVNDADDGSVLDLSIAIGPHFVSKDGR